MIKKGRKNHKGAMLIEVLLAVVIMAVSLTLIIQSLMTSRRALVYSRDYSLAVFLLDNVMFQLMQKEWIDSSSQEEGDISEPYERFKYRIEARDISEDNFPERLQEVQVDVYWPAGINEKKISAVTYLFNQPPSPE